MIIFLLVILMLLNVIVFNTISFRSREEKVEIKKNNIDLNLEKSIQRFAGGIQIPTISYSEYDQVNWKEFKRFREYLEKSYPLVYKNLEVKEINEHSLVYIWRGEDTNQLPALITGHIDVVPIEEETINQWKCKPFSGEIKDGFVWGRGTLDTKVTIFAALESVEYMLEKGMKPHRDIYLAFGHDEEVGGYKGAVKIAEYFQQEGVEFEFTIDEGGCVVDGALKGIEKPVGYIGIAEKGYVNIRLSTEQSGGHASMPPLNTSLGEISKIICNMEKKQMSKKMSYPVKLFLDKVGKEMGLVNRILISNMWLFKPILMKVLARNEAGNALLRTTTAATMAKASMEPNVLPQKSSVTFNFRVAPHNTSQDLLSHIKKNSKGIKHNLEILRMDEPSKISPVDTHGFKSIETQVQKLYPEAIAAPYLVLAGTDARKYENVCHNIYRFAPYRINKEQLGTIHSVNERISIENYKNYIEFFVGIFLDS